MQKCRQDIPDVARLLESKSKRGRGLFAMAVRVATGLLTTALWSQVVQVHTFDAVSIKANLECQGRGRAKQILSPTTLTMTCSTLMDMVRVAYVTAVADAGSSKLPHISGGPSWANTVYFDIQAKSEQAVTPREIAGQMFQSVLQDRFQLKTRTEIREGAVYTLTTAKDGARLPVARAGSCPSPGEPPSPDTCGNIGVRPKGSNLTITARGVTLDQVADFLAGGLNLDVLNKTNLPGIFDFQFSFSANESTPGFQFGPPRSQLPSEEPLEQTLFEAFQSQFGIKLSQGRGLIKFIIIDNVEKPTPN